MEYSEGLSERKKRESRERIIAAAASLFIERGARSVSLDDVAKAAEVARRTLFNYFSSKDELLFATIAPMLEEAIGFVDSGRSAEGADLDAVFSLCLGLWRSWGRRLSLLYAVELADSPRLSALHASFLSRFRRLVAAATALEPEIGPRGLVVGRIVYRCFVPLLLALEGEKDIEERFARGMRGLITGAAREG